MRDPNGEFHLEPLENGRWKLYPVAISPPFSYCWEERQPGEPVEKEWEFENGFAEQPLNFVLRVLPGDGAPQEDAVINPSFEVNFHQITFPVRLLPQQYLVCEGDGQGRVYDVNWNLLQIVDADSELPKISAGTQRIRFHCDEETKHRVEVKFKTIGEPELVDCQQARP